MKVVGIVFVDPSVLGSGGPKKIESFIECLYRFTPDISVRENQGCAVFLEISKCRFLYSDRTLWARIQVLLKKFELCAQVTLAPDLPTALVLAHRGRVDFRKMPLKDLSFYIDPLAVNPDTEKEVLRMEQELQRLGLRSIAEFMSLPLRSLTNRFGRLAEKTWRRLHSPSLLKSIPRTRWRPPEVIEERIFLHENEECLDIEPLLFSCRLPLERIMARLQGRGLRLTRFSLKLECDRRSSNETSERVFYFNFIYPQSTLSGVLPLVRERLSRELQNQPLDSPVIGLHAFVLETTLGRHGQKNFFSHQEEIQEELLGLLERLTEKLGAKHVFYAEVTERYFPEQSWRKVNRPGEVHAAAQNLPYGERPLRLLPQPLPLFRVGRNLLVENLRGRDHRWIIKTVHAPERIYGEWWDEAQPRDYYRIEIEGSPDLWIYREKGLFLHGFFGDPNE